MFEDKSRVVVFVKRSLGTLIMIISVSGGISQGGPRFPFLMMFSLSFLLMVTIYPEIFSVAPLKKSIIYPNSVEV